MTKKANTCPRSSFATGVEEFDGTLVPNSTITGYSVKGSTATFSFVANDETSTFECKRDAGAWGACTSEKEYTGLTTGNHEFAVRASNAEATESIPAISVGAGGRRARSPTTPAPGR